MFWLWKSGCWAKLQKWWKRGDQCTSIFHRGDRQRCHMKSTFDEQTQNKKMVFRSLDASWFVDVLVERWFVPKVTQKCLRSLWAHPRPIIYNFRSVLTTNRLPNYIIELPICNSLFTIYFHGGPPGDIHVMMWGVKARGLALLERWKTQGFGPW